MVTAYVALGANLGDAQACLKLAVLALDALPLSRVNKTSSLYKSAPLEVAFNQDAGGDYVNAVAEIETLLGAPALLHHLHLLEQSAGRARPYANAPRTLDLDLLLYGTARIDSAQLTVPHPRMWQRAFVLVPLAEIAPELVAADALAAVALQTVDRFTAQG